MHDIMCHCQMLQQHHPPHSHPYSPSNKVGSPVSVQEYHYDSRALWLKAIKLKNPKAHTLICQLHFANEDVVFNVNRRRLSCGAVPTRNLPEDDEAAADTEPTDVDEETDPALAGGDGEVKSEPDDDDGAIFDLFTEENTVVHVMQKRFLDTPELKTDLSEVPIKRERLDESEEGGEMQPSYRYDTSFPRPIVPMYNQDQNPTNSNEIIDKPSSNCPPDVPTTSHGKQIHLLIKLSKAYLNPEIAKFIEVQALLKRQLEETFKCKKYSKDMLLFALNLYHKYPQTYKLMQESFLLPSLLQIRQLCRNLSWELNDSWAAVLRARFEHASVEDRECVVCVAKSRLSLAVSYDPVRDCMTGLAELNGKQRARAARYAIVVYARGIFSRWRQPLSYVILPASSLSEELWSWLEDLISKLIDIGLSPRALVSDFDDNYNLLSRPLPRSNSFLQLKNKQIYCLRDCTQLMIKLRDCLIKYNVLFKGMKAEWEVIEELFEYDSTRRYKLGAGLTAEHVNPVGSVARQPKLAIETMSSKVASAVATAVDIRVLDDSAHGTVQFITSFSALYDTLHNKELYFHEKGIAPESKFLHEMLMNMEKTVFLDKQNTNFVTLKVMDNFCKNICAVLALQERMRHAGYTSLPMRAFNNDPLHEFFNRVQSLNGKRYATGRQLIDAFRRSFVFNTMKSFSKEGKLDGFLKAASGIKNVRMQVDRPAFKGLVKENHIAPLKRPAMGAHILLAQCARVKPCCKLGLKFCKNPPAAVTEYMNMMENKFKLHFATEKLSEGVMASILASLEEDQFSAPCPCFPVLYLKALYLRFRIANLVEYNNTKFRRGISRDITMNVNVLLDASMNVVT